VARTSGTTGGYSRRIAARDVRDWRQPASHSALDQFSPTTRCIVPDLEVPIRAELFGVERLKLHAESLAAAQVVFSEPRLYPLLTRVFWKTTTCCWSPTESLPGRFSRSM
jgi:hypothetical protein